jgi:protein-tyrosine phosphatase
MIDVHTHLLPGVDDGSPSIGASVPVLERFAAEGVEALVCTPHLKATRAATAPFEQHRQIFDELVAAAPAVPRLLLGWEILLDAPGLNLTDPRLALGGSTAVLVEFTRHLPAHTAAELARLTRSGIVPVVAHPERYRECTPALVTQWRSAGAVMQMDVPSIFGSQRLSTLAEALLSEGLVDLFSSDTHVDSRSLGFARGWLSELAPPDTVDLLTRENARRLLAGEPVLPVPPIRLHRGMFQRLRELVLSRATH